MTAIAGDFSPRYERHGDDLVSIDVSGLQRMLKVKEGCPVRTIGGELARDAASRGVRVHVAVAGTRMAAVVIALATPGVTVVSPGEEAAALAPIPIGILEKICGDQTHRARPSTGSGRAETANTHSLMVSLSNHEHSAAFAVFAFKRWGLTTLGELAALPAADLVARLGPPARLWQAIARGEDVRPLVPTLAEERFDSTIELEWPIEGLEPLSFVLTRLIEPLSTRLERRDRGAAVLHVLLGLVNRDCHARRLELPTPMRDVRTLRTLALLDLEAHPPPAAIDRVTIVIDPTPGRVLQHTLFTRAHPTPEQLSTLVARLGALMGQDRFGAPAMVDSYRPGAFAMVPLRGDIAGLQNGRIAELPIVQFQSCHPAIPQSCNAIVSALRRCRHPVPARVAVVDDRPVRVTTDRRGFTGGTVVHCAGPWRSSGEWWKSETCKSEVRSQKSETSDFRLQTSDLPWNRDEWDVSLNDGGVYRIFRNRENDAWFIDAIVD